MLGFGSLVRANAMCSAAYGQLSGRTGSANQFGAWRRNVAATLILSCTSVAATAGCWNVDTYTWYCSYPTAAFSSPANGSTVSPGAVIPLVVNAATGADDETGAAVLRVEYLIGTTVIGTVNAPANSSSFTATFNWTPPGSGSYIIKARAVGARGESGAGHPTGGQPLTGSQVSLNLTVNAPPAISMSAPVNGSSVSGPTATIAFSATASDSGGSVTKVDFLSGGAVVGTATAAPYQFSLAGVPAGTYSLSARATDNNGATTTTASASVRVNALPTATISSSANSGIAPANFSLSSTASDPDGSVTQVEFLANGQSLGVDASAPYSLAWNGVAAGSYVVTARATDSNGQQTTSAGTTVTVNPNVLPSVALSAPADGTVINGPTGSMNLSAVASDSDGSVTQVQFLSGASVLATVTAAPYQYTWSGVAAGSYSLSARATDSSGGVSTSAPRGVRVNALPSATVTASPSSAIAPATFTLTALASDSDGSISQVEFFANGASIGIDSSAPFALAWSNVVVGTYYVTVRATDNNGQQTTSPAIVVNAMANSLPTVTLTSPSNGAVFNGPASSITMSATATDSDGSVSRVEFLSGGGVIGTATAAPYQFTWTNVAAGTYAISARVTDSHGGATTSAVASVRINALPTISATASPPTATAPAAFSLSASASDSDGTINQVEFFADGTLIGTDSAAPFNFSWTNVPAGGYTVTARVTDNNGQQATSAPISLTSTVPANVAPSISMTSPASGASYSYPASVSLAASATDSDGSISKVEFYANGSLIGQVTGSTGHTMVWSNDSPGTYSVTAVATDNQGGTATSSPVSVVISDSGGGGGGTPGGAPSSAAGSLPGDLKVDPSGSAAYSVPIQLPPGTAGVVPSLAFSYSSNGGDGLLGYGWSVTGFSSITRCGKSRATDDPTNTYTTALGRANKVRVNFDANDQFCLDGQRLVLVAGSHGANAEYRTEMDSFSKILSFGSDPTKGPDRWEVWTKAGSIIDMGATPDSRLDAAGRSPVVVLSWAASRVRDRRNNYYSITYLNNAAAGEIVPHEIRYTGNSSGTGGFSPYHSIRFVYDAVERPDPVEGFVVGSPVSIRKRLDKLQIVLDTAADGSGGADVREYRLLYTQNPINGRSLVVGLQDCARPVASTTSGYACTPATTFDYSERTSADDAFNAPGGGAWGGPDLRLTSQERTSNETLRKSDALTRIHGNAAFADFDGDGRMDVAAAYGEGAWNVCLSTGTSFNCQPWIAPGTSDRALIGDFNGDGAADIVIPPNWGGTNWTTCLSTRSAFNCQSWIGTGDFGMRISDLNGDGRDDFIMVGTNQAPSHRACVFTGNGFDCSAWAPGDGRALAQGLSCETEESSTASYCTAGYEGQFDGSGRSGTFFSSGTVDEGGGDFHLCTMNETGASCTPVATAISDAPHSIAHRKSGSITAHLNHDGADAYSDIVLSHLGALTGTQTCTPIPGTPFGSCVPDRGPKRTQVCRGTGTGLSCTVLPAPARTNDYAFLRIADMDGDGRADGISVGFGDTGASLYRVCQLAGTASCRDFPAAVVSSPFSAHVADFNGDGIEDIAWHHRTHDSWTVRLARKAVPDLLVSVTNGIGHVTTISYDSLRNPAIYTPDTGAVYPLRDVYDSSMVVSQVRRDNGLGGGGTLDTSYRYGGAKTDITGRGFLGFRWFEALDSTSQVRTRTEVSQTFPTTGMPTSVVATHLPSGVAIKTITNTLASAVTVNPTGPNPKAYLSYVSGSTEINREINGGAEVSRTTASGIVVNAYGDEEARTTTTLAGGQTFAESAATSYSNQVASWLVGRPLQVSVTRSAPGYANVTRVKDLSYTALGELEVEITENGDATGTLRSSSRLLRDATTGVVTSREVSWTEAAVNGAAWPEDGTARTRTLETLAYDPRKRYPTTVTNALGHTETRVHDPRTGQPSSVTDRNLLVSSWVMDGFGRRTRETRPDGTYTITAYAPCASGCGSVRMEVTTQSFTAANAAMTPPVTVYLDALGRSVRWASLAFDGRQRLGEREYDAKGRLLRKARTRFSTDGPVWTSYLYDDLGRVTSTTSPIGTATVAHSGLQTVLTNEKGQNRTELRNGMGKLRTVTDHYAKATQYAYEPFGNLAKVTDPLGNEITVTYDRLGRKTQMRDPDLGTWSYVLNAMGEVRSQTDARGQITRSRFDALGRQLTRLTADLNANWEYDVGARALGKLSEAYTLTGTGTRDYRRLHSYDALGRPLRTTERLDIDYVTESSYDSATGRLARSSYRRYPVGGSSGATIDIDYGYNAQGYLERMLDGATVLWAVNQQDALDRITRQTFGNGIVTRRDFRSSDARLQNIVAGRLSGAEPDGLAQNDSYQYDVLGNLSFRSQLNASGGLLQENFGYDALNRLTSAEVIGQAVRAYGYDDIGNITSKHGVGSYSYPPSGAASVRPHAVSAINGIVAGIANPGFSYDANGNLLAGLGRSTSWSAANVPLQIVKAAGAGPGSAGSGSATDSFVYGPELQRIRQSLAVTGGPSPGSTTWWYGGPIEKETRSADNTTHVRVRLPQGIVLIDRYASAGADVTSPAGATRQTRWYQKDRLGSTVAVSDEAGNVIERQYYDPWGKRRQGDGSDADTLASLDHRHGYTEHEHLDAVGLVHMNGRVYDPTLGRFMSADPTVPDPSDGQNFNRYTYVLNNPNVYTDPSGFAQVREADRISALSAARMAEGILGAAGQRQVFWSMDDIPRFDCMGGGDCEPRRPSPLKCKIAPRPECSMLKADSGGSDNGDAGSPESNRQGLTDTDADRMVGFGLKVSADWFAPGFVALVRGASVTEVAVEAAQTVPLLKGFGLAVKFNKVGETAKGAANATKEVPDSALVCRGGACRAENFVGGNGVTRAADGTLSGVSTQSRAGASVEELAKPFKNNQVGLTTAGDIRRAGGRVTPDGTPGNPNHATVDGLTEGQLERLFSPTRLNPVPPGRRGL